jgi:hypothetical protein
MTGLGSTSNVCAPAWGWWAWASAELAGGRLDIESAPGAGTTLRARFPLPFPESVAGTDQ